MEELVKEIYLDVSNIFRYGIESTSAYVVPTRDDSGLTFPYNDTKKGKTIETCVLFVDIRNSTRMSTSYSKNKELLGKIYSSFIHSMVSIADSFGYVRNIIGDRIMVVFEPNNCVEYALRCAVLMNTVHNKLIRTIYKDFNYRIGIGIDYGEMLVLKTGIQKKNEERSEYKGLVWIGNTANIASKLTDLSSKTITKELVSISYEEKHYFRPLMASNNYIDILLGQQKVSPISSLFPTFKTEEVSLSQLLDNSKIEDGVVLYNGNKVKSITKFNNIINTPAILLSSKVMGKIREIKSKINYTGSLSKIEVNNPSLENVYGGNLFFKDIINLAL